MKNPILEEIESTIREHQFATGVVRISVSEKPVLESFSNGERAWIKWLCWSINDAHGTEVVEPRFEICCPSLTVEQVRSDFGERILGLCLEVDNDIEA